MYARFVGHRPFKRAPRPDRPDDRDAAAEMKRRREQEREQGRKLRQRYRGTVLSAAGKLNPRWNADPNIGDAALVGSAEAMSDQSTTKPMPVTPYRHGEDQVEADAAHFERNERCR
jgi:hypothetical protein